MSTVSGYLRGGMAGCRNVLSFQFPSLSGRLLELRRHAVYVRILGLLLCIAFAAVFLQAGTLILLDHVRGSRSLAEKVQRSGLHWTVRLDIARTGAADAGAILHHLGDAGLDPRDAELVRRGHPGLGVELDAIGEAEREFRLALTQDAPVARWLPLAEEVAAGYARLDAALRRDLEVRQAIVSALQLTCLLFLLFCVVRVALEARRALMERLGRLMDLIPDRSSYSPILPERDEFFRLEQGIAGLTARLEGCMAEATRSSGISEHLRRVTGAQEFLLRFVESINGPALNEAMLRKMLYSLERALDLDNAAIIYTEEELPTSTGRSVYSSHEPHVLSDSLFSDLYLSGSSIHVGTNPDGSETRCVAVAFVEPSGEKAALLVEMDKDRLLDHAETQVLEIAAGLLSITSKFQNHDQEGRRIAVLEERAAIARELHDSLAQSLSFMKIQLARVQSSPDINAESSRAMLRELRTGLDTAYRELRELLTTFRVHLDGRGLNHAIQSAIDEFSQRSSLSITLDNRLVNCRLTVNEEFHILQVVREALSNIVHHARAGTAFIEMTLSATGAVAITIDDDGVGYSPGEEGYGHHGQAIMKERAYSLGGTIKVRTRRQGGTRVRLMFTPQLAQ